MLESPRETWVTKIEPKGPKMEPHAPQHGGFETKMWSKKGGSSPLLAGIETSNGFMLTVTIPALIHRKKVWGPAAEAKP